MKYKLTESPLNKCCAELPTCATSSSLNFHYCTLTSATPRSSSSPTARLPRPTGMGSTPENTVPELVVEPVGTWKAPGFVQQMLFSAPVQELSLRIIDSFF